MANFKLKENLDIKSSGISESGKNMLPKTGDIIPFAGTTAPIGWIICDGSGGTPDLRGRFVAGANSSANIGTVFGNLTHTHTYSTNSFNTSGITESHTAVDTGVTIGGAVSHSHSQTGILVNTTNGNNNLLANSGNASGPIQFNDKPHSHNSNNGAVNFNSVSSENHNHAGITLATSTSTTSHATAHSVTGVPTGNAVASDSKVPFIIMNYIMKV